ncbi:MAG: TonB-dependent receptor [bacterium]|nr:TonB-dependent receptor [bacterium]
MKKIIRFLFLLFLCIGLSATIVNAQPEVVEEPAAEAEVVDDSADTEGDELAFYELENMMDATVTTAGKIAQKASAAPSIITVITANEIKNMGAKDLADVLRTVPGFDAVVNPQWRSKIVAVRGMFNTANDNAKVKFMLNGHTLRDNENNIVLYFDFIPIHLVKQIEIIRGPGSALYGTGAFFGVINIITQDGKGETKKDLEIGATGSYGTFNTTNNHANFSLKSGDLEAYFFAEYNRTDGHTKTIDSDGPAAAFGIANSAAPGPSKSDHSYLNVFTNVSYGNLSVQALFAHAEYNPYLGAAYAVSDDCDGVLNMGYVEAAYKMPLSKKGNINAKVYADLNRYHNTFELYSEETTSGALMWSVNEGAIASTAQTYMTTGAEVTLEYDLTSWLKSVTGVFYEFVRAFDDETKANAQIFVNPGPITINGTPYGYTAYLGGLVDTSDTYPFHKDTNRHNIAAYEQVTIDFKDLFSLQTGVNSLALTGGVRADWYNDFGVSINPRAGLVYGPIEELYFKALFGMAFRAPSFNELYVYNNPAQEGNPNLDPETITTIEALVGLSPMKNLKATITGFYIQAKDLIQEDKTAAVPKLQNMGNVNSLGVEGEVKVVLEKNKYAFCNVSYQKVTDVSHDTITHQTTSNTYTQVDFDPGGRPLIIINGGVNYEFIEFINTNVSINYSGERSRSKRGYYTQTDVTGTLNYDTRDKIASSVTLNAGLAFRIGFLVPALKGLEASFYAYNILDTDVRDPDFSVTVLNDYPRAGRSFLGKVSYKF